MQEERLFQNFFESHGPEGAGDVAAISAYLEGLGGRGISRKTFRKNTESRIDSSILIDKRYSILEPISTGSYGKVFKVMDEREKVIRAMKILNNITDKDRIFARREFSALFKSNNLDKDEENYIVKMTGAFYIGNHLGLVFELLGPTIFDILLVGGGLRKEVFEMNQVKSINWQILKATSYLHRQGLIHHDIKTNNVAFVCGDYDTNDDGKLVMRNTTIRLIDLGSCTESEPRGRLDTATTIQYRSPEMTFGVNWCLESDIWSLGCTFFEVYSGFILFNCASEIEKYYMIEKVLMTQIPVEMAIRNGRPMCNCFDARGSLIYNAETQRLRDRVKNLDSYKRKIGDVDTTRLFALLHRMIVLDPYQRISAANALKDPFFEGVEIPPN